MTARCQGRGLLTALDAPPLWLIYGVVGVVALGMRLAFLLRAPVFIIGDSENYFWPGYQLARGIGFDLELRRTPGYPLFIAGVVRYVGEDLAALALAQHLLGVVVCLAVLALAARYWGRWAGLLAGLLVALSGPLLVAEQYVMAETLFIPLATLTVAWLALALERPRWWSLVIGGMLVGVAALTRPVGLVLAVAALLTLPVAAWWRLRTAPGVADARWPFWIGRLLFQAVALVFGVALIWLPWMIRNASVHGSFSAEGNAGQTLVGRAMRHDRGFVFDDPADPDPARQRAREIMRNGRGGFVSPVRERIKRDLGLSDAEANKLMRDLAFEAIIRQPGYYLCGTAVWFGRLAVGTPERYRDHWHTRRDSGSREEWESYLDIRHLLGGPTPIQQAQQDEADALINVFQSARLGPMIPLLALLGALGLALGIGVRERRPCVAAFLLLVVVGLLLAAVALVAPLARYRYPIEPLLALLAGGGASTAASLARVGVARLRGWPSLA